MSSPGAPRLYLVRHCHATGQEHDAPLTAEGARQAVALADLLDPLGIERIISSPFRRARDSIAPLAARLGIPIEYDDRLIERVLSPRAVPDWRAHLRTSFDDPDYCLAEGESSRTAATRAVAVLNDLARRPRRATAIVTHGNLLALLLRSFNPDIGFADWERLTNPDVFSVLVAERAAPITRIWR